MKKTPIALALLLASLVCPTADAQVKARWRLHWSNEKPQNYVYTTPNGQHKTYWFMTFKVHNGTDQIVPVIFDVMLYTERGKELQNDPLKIDEANIKAEEESPDQSEALKYGRFYASVIDPEAEYKIIEYHAKLGARSPGLVRESIEAFKDGFKDDPPPEFGPRWKKGDRMYLNPREMRRHRAIMPGQTLMGIAIFTNMDPRARAYQVHVTGLVDILRITDVTVDEWKIEYEPQTKRIHYYRFGDPFNVERNVIYKRQRADWTVKKIGPIAAKDTIDRLVLALFETYKKQKEWADEKVAAEEIAARQKRQGIDGLDTRIMAMVFRLATGLDFGYDPTKSALENQRAVLRIHEWWVNNRTRLAFDPVRNQFVAQDKPLPGTVKPKQ